jgi:TetR/AcrR family transcriptional repressor of nem operon
MRYDADHKERTRVRVVSAAAKSILADGPHRVGVAEVMGRAGLTHGGFYAHFPSKDELIVAAIATMFEGALANLQQFASGKPPAEAVAAYVDWYLSPRHRDARETGCPMAALAGDLPRLGDAARRRFARGADRLIDRLAVLLSALEHAEPRSLAASAFAEMVGALALARGAEAKDSDALLEGSRLRLKARLARPPDGSRRRREASTASPTGRAS